MKRWYLLLWAALPWGLVAGQSVGIGTTTPDPSARLDIVSTTQGFLPPTLTAAQRVAITSPAAGLMVYQTDGVAGFYCFNGTGWVSFTSGQPVNGTGMPVVSKDYGLTFTFAGTGAVGLSNGAALTATFYLPTGIAVDGVGNIYISDKHNNVIRKIDAGGIVSTFAGSGTAGYADGQGTAAIFNQPAGVAVDAAGNVYVADQNNNRIRKITPQGQVSTIAGSGSIGNVNGSPSVASFYYPSGVAVDGAGNVYVADTYNNEIRRIGTDGLVAILAGYTGAGSADGVGTDAAFNGPMGITVGADGNLYVADYDNNAIRKVTPGGAVTTFVTAGLNRPAGIAADAGGYLYVANQGDNNILRVSMLGAVLTLSGSGQISAANGPGNVAGFNNPAGIGVDGDGNVLVADSYSDLIRKIIAK
jgi:sugar lactone lactonase YvrE